MKGFFEENKIDKIKKTYNLYEEAWQDMPEFIQEEQKMIKSIIVHFEKKEDIEKFSELTGIKITYSTKYIYFPKKKKKKLIDKCYIDE